MHETYRYFPLARELLDGGLRSNSYNLQKMIKTIIAFATGALLSLNASAGYVQYNLTGPVSGIVIQHDTDQSMALYNLFVDIEGTWTPFRMQLSPQESEGVTQLTYATTHFLGYGPSNFGIYSDFGGDQRTLFDISFSGGDEGEFEYVANYSSSILFGNEFQKFTGKHTGYATVGIVDPLMALGLDYIGGYDDNLKTRFVPTYIGRNPVDVPEPGSLALLVAGAIGFLNIRRRRQT